MRPQQARHGSHIHDTPRIFLAMYPINSDEAKSCLSAPLPQTLTRDTATQSSRVMVLITLVPYDFCRLLSMFTIPRTNIHGNYQGRRPSILQPCGLPAHHKDLQRLCGKIANVVDATRSKKSLGTLDRISPRNCRSLASFCVNVTFWLSEACSLQRFFGGIWRHARSTKTALTSPWRSHSRLP